MPCEYDRSNIHLEAALGAPSGSNKCASHLFKNGESTSRLHCNPCCLALQALALRDTFDESLAPLPAPSYLQTLAAVG